MEDALKNSGFISAKWYKTIDVAVKVQSTGKISAEGFLTEAKFMNWCQHDKVVRIYGVCSKVEPIYIVTELMNDNLLHHLREGDGRFLKIEGMIDYAGQIASGMSYLEREMIIHRDLAARNILVGAQGIVKLAEFGRAKLLCDGVYNANKDDKFPIKWTAPEAAFNDRFTLKSDVWSYGILLVEITTHGAAPYPGMNDDEVLNQVSKGYRMPKPAICPDIMYEVMVKCWDKRSEQRPTFEFLHEFFDDYSISTEPGYVNVKM